MRGWLKIDLNLGVSRMLVRCQFAFPKILPRITWMWCLISVRGAHNIVWSGGRDLPEGNG